jgi:urease accessory protein
MLTVDKLIPRGRGLAPALLKRATDVALDWDTRQKSRFDAIDSAGRALGVFLPRGVTVRGGDVLVAEDGSLIRVAATPQPVMVVRACAEHGAPTDLLRAAYHLGNRHVALEVQPDRLQLEPDHVLADMLRRMHLLVDEVVAPFEPEAGAYGGGAAEGHGHGHGHAHAEDAGSGHRHDPVHGPGCNHGHGHDPDHDRPHGHEARHAHGDGHACSHDHAHDHTHDHARRPG